MNRVFFSDGHAIPYVLFRKPVKNLSARVRRDGSLAVTIPYSCADWQVDAFLGDHWPAILRAMATAAAQNAESIQTVCDGATIPFFGVQTTLRFLRGQVRSVKTQGDELHLILLAGECDTRYATLLSSYLQEQAKMAIDNTCREIYDSFFKNDFVYPTIRYRRMTARWGSCRKQDSLILFNTRLVYAPPASIAYVVLHEFAHMLQPNHSPAFYAEVAARMPDYRVRAAALKQIDLHRERWL